MENGVLPPPRFTLHRKDPHADKERAVSSFRQPRRRPVFLTERIILLNRPLQLFLLFGIFLCLCTAEGRSSVEQGLAFCHLDFVPPQEPFPHLSCCRVPESPKKKKRWLDLCFPGVSVPHLTYQSLSRQEAAEFLWAKPLAKEERSPAAACGFCMCFFRSPTPSPPNMHAATPLIQTTHLP